MAYAGRKPEVDQSVDALNKMKVEIANELGIANYDKIDKGDLPARLHGKIGGNMVRRMITNYEKMISENPQLIEQADPIAEVQLQQDKQIIQQRYANLVNNATTLQ